MTVISQIAAQNLGTFLQIAFVDKLFNQISKSHKDWDAIEKLKKGGPDGREQRFLFQTAFGPAAVQMAAPGAAGSFPTGQQISVSEKTAVYKEIHATIEVEYNLWDRARKSPTKYNVQPLIAEVEGKATSAKRQLSRQLYGDGTGVLGEISSSAWLAGSVIVTLKATNTARGGANNFEYGDKIMVVTPAGAEHKYVNGAGTSADYLIVTDKDRTLNTATFSGYTTAGLLLVLTAAGTVVDATDVMYRYAQPTKTDLTAISTGAAFDYNGLTEEFAGLESLAATDGRMVHGIVMSGATGGSRYDAGTAALDVAHVQASLALAKVRVGADQFSWDQMLMAPEGENALIESRETDRRFVSVTDNKRGINKFVYVHGTDQLEVVSSEFCPKKRIYMIPKAKGSGNNAIEFWGSDMEMVKPGGNGSEWMLRPGSSTHDRMIRAYMLGYVCLLSRQPSAINVIHNFTV